MITVGIDVGSISAKAALVEDTRLIGSRVILTGYNARNAGQTVFDELLAELKIPAEAVDRIVATGYGRNSVDLADKAVLAAKRAGRDGVVSYADLVGTRTGC